MALDGSRSKGTLLPCLLDGADAGGFASCCFAKAGCCHQMLLPAGAAASMLAGLQGTGAVVGGCAGAGTSGAFDASGDTAPPAVAAAAAAAADDKIACLSHAKEMPKP